MNNQALDQPTQPTMTCDMVCQTYHQTAQALRQHQDVQSQKMEGVSEDVLVEKAIAEIVYIYDLVEQRNICSSRSITELLGYTSEAIEAMGEMELADLIHPDDLERVADHFLHFGALPAGVMVEISYRMKRVDGQWCWLRSRETPLVEAKAQYPRSILGIIQMLSLPIAINHVATGANHKMIADETI